MQNNMNSLSPAGQSHDEMTYIELLIGSVVLYRTANRTVLGSNPASGWNTGAAYIGHCFIYSSPHHCIPVDLGTTRVESQLSHIAN